MTENKPTLVERLLHRATCDSCDDTVVNWKEIIEALETKDSEIADLKQRLSEMAERHTYER